MTNKEIRKLVSRIVRHSGFTVRKDKLTDEYNFSDDSSPEPVLFCKVINLESEKAEMETYLCFRVLEPLTDNRQKLYNRMIKRFTKLAPSFNISFEDESKPIFTDEELERIDSLYDEIEIEGEQHDSKQITKPNSSI